MRAVSTNTILQSTYLPQPFLSSAISSTHSHLFLSSRSFYFAPQTRPSTLHYYHAGASACLRFRLLNPTETLAVVFLQLFSLPDLHFLSGFLFPFFSET